MFSPIQLAVEYNTSIFAPRQLNEFPRYDSKPSDV